MDGLIIEIYDSLCKEREERREAFMGNHNSESEFECARGRDQEINSVLSKVIDLIHTDRTNQLNSLAESRGDI